MMDNNDASDPTKRFSDRVDNYARYRPEYPVEIVAHLTTETGLLPTHKIADIGSGTGLLARRFLEFGCAVTGIEPNASMRKAAEKLLANEARFNIVSGRAEQTGLPARSLDYVVAGQAAHWFDPVQSRVELCRILKPGGWVVFVWNTRPTKGDPFLQAYETMLEEVGHQYEQVRSRNMEAGVADWFAPAPVREAEFTNPQFYDFDMFRGRALSSSYAPLAGDPNHALFLAELRRIFDKFQHNGSVQFAYQTRLYYGQPG
jgi:SAM-dependent methyltransferase